MAKITGIGGIFFKSENLEKMRSWYKTNVGLESEEWGTTFPYKDNEGKECYNIWAPFKSDTKYFEPSKKEFMINFKVDDLVELLEQLKQKGVEVSDDIQDSEYGKFGWFIDLEGNKIELWQPN